jgi:hypothetical protein
MRGRDPEEPWYREGLSFACTRCGHCCTGAPGYVWVNAEEIDRIAAYRGETLEQFSKRFVRRVGARHSLVERPGGDCIFWSSDEGCTVYPARPAQCQTWPFWPENIADRAAWEQVCRTCPGSGAEGAQVFTVEEIRATAARIHTP